MTENNTTIVLTDAAAALVKADIAAFKRDTRRYLDYVAEMNVTAETVADHVAVFRAAYRDTVKNADGDAVKAYATKVRNGLNYHVKKNAEAEGETAINMLTRDGRKSDDLARIIAEWVDAGEGRSLDAVLTAVDEYQNA